VVIATKFGWNIDPKTGQRHDAWTVVQNTSRRHPTPEAGQRIRRWSILVPESRRPAEAGGE
jgi:hypothetical protein